MSTLYFKAAEMLANWSGEDVGLHRNPRQMSQEIVDMIIKDIRENGFPALEKAAAHDSGKE